MSVDLGATLPSDVRTRNSPYVGLVPYGEEDAPFFFGRERGARLLTANLFAAPLTVLYGPSGVGKSSLLRAGLAYQSRARDDLLVVVFNAWQGEPVAALKAALEQTYATVARPRAADHNQSAHAGGLPLGEYLVGRADEIERRLMIVLDQFEEYFLYHSGDEPFGMQFPAAVAQSDRSVSFLISIREDAFAKLHRFGGRIPGLFDNILRLEDLDRPAADEAIRKPVEQYNRLVAPPGAAITIEPSLIEAVLQDDTSEREGRGEGSQGKFRLAGTLERIDPSDLQIVMTRLWDEEQNAGSRALRLETLTRLGGKSMIRQTHLYGALNALDPADQDVADQIFHHLVTPSGTKIALSAYDLARYTALDRGRIDIVLSRLSQPAIRVLRPIRGLRQPDEPLFEIYHDRLADAILSWRQYRAERRLADERARSKEELDAAHAESERLLMEQQAEAERLLAEQKAEAEALLAHERALAQAAARTRQRYLLAIVWTFFFWVSFGVVWLLVTVTILNLSAFVLSDAGFVISVLLAALAGGWFVGWAVRAKTLALRPRQMWLIRLWWIVSAVGVFVVGVAISDAAQPILIMPIFNLLSPLFTALGLVSGFLGQAYVAGSLTLREVDRVGGFDPSR